jgi:hypothetical protein
MADAPKGGGGGFGDSALKVGGAVVLIVLSIGFLKFIFNDGKLPTPPAPQQTFNTLVGPPRSASSWGYIGRSAPRYVCNPCDWGYYQDPVTCQCTRGTWRPGRPPIF